VAFLLAFLLFVRPAPISLHVTPLVCLAPCTLRITATIERHDLNRYYLIALDGEDFYRESTFPLEGDQAARTQPPFEIKDVPPGEYQVIAVVYRATLKHEAGRATATVLIH
jgi:hypothetical protein